MNARKTNFETDGMVPEETSGRMIATSYRDGQDGPRQTSHETPQATPLRTPRKPASVAGPSVSSNSKELLAAQELANLFDQYLRLVNEEHATVTGAARLLGKPASFFSGKNSMLSRYVSEGLAGLLPAPRNGDANTSDLTREIEALGWFIPAARYLYIHTNRSSGEGSVPEAIRRVMSLPHLPNGWRNDIRAKFMRVLRDAGFTELPTCPPELREKLLARERDGQPFVEKRIHRQITSHRGIVELHRRPRESKLNWLSAEGSTMWVRKFGQEPEFIRAGRVIEADDGSINFPVTIPWTFGDTTPDDKCVSKFGVIVGRFQWLRSRDVGSRYRPAWAFIARPRGSYRSEDIVSLLRTLCLQHGIWDTYRFEKGSWKARSVTELIKLLGANLQTVHSPHAKPFIEGGFNQDWTKLSAHFPHCDLGRYRGDTEATNKLVQACRAGSQDPRKLFPSLADAMIAFDQITQEENETPVNTQWGRWVPQERWEEQKRDHLKPFPIEMEWAFCPFVKDWMVRGTIAKGSVNLFEDISPEFAFTAPFLWKWHGCRVRLYFDPRDPKCFATVVALEEKHGHKIGDILGHAEQTNETAGYIRTILGWGNDPTTAGLKARQRNAAGMVRELRGVIPSGRGLRTIEARDGISNINKGEVGEKSDSGSDSGRGVPPLSGARARGTDATTEPPKRLSLQDQFFVDATDGGQT